MIESLQNLLPRMAAQANLAPSVHNIQPSRWRIDGDRLELLGDLSRTIPAADPKLRDWYMSHGCQFEGMMIALAAVGYGLANVSIETDRARDNAASLVTIASAEVSAADRSHEQAALDLALARQRQTWRGGFQETNRAAMTALSQLSSARPDCVFISGAHELRNTAALYDAASMHFLRDVRHRKELLSWMRLWPSHADYDRDGLSAAAMGLGRIEAWAAGLVLGPLFGALNATGLAQAALSEAAKTRSATAIVLLPRPVDEDPFETGRHFYRLWLDFERFGFKACPMSALVDWDKSRLQLEQNAGIEPSQKLCAGIRIGLAKGSADYPRARLPVDELLI